MSSLFVVILKPVKPKQVMVNTWVHGAFLLYLSTQSNLYIMLFYKGSLCVLC